VVRVAWVERLGLAVAAAAIDTIMFTRFTEDPQRVYWVHTDVPPLMIVVAGALLVPLLLLRQRAPVVAVLALAGYSALLTVEIGSRPLISLLIALYSVAGRRSRAVSLGCLAAIGLAQCLAVGYEVSGLTTGRKTMDTALVAVFFAFLDVGAWALGRWVRWSARLRELTAAHSAAEAVTAERARIARDLHDVVAHSLTLMLLQASGAAAVLRIDPQRSATALAAVDTVGKQALVELRRMLDLLYRDSGMVDDVSVGSQAPSGLRDLEDLVEQARTAQLSVELTVTGDRRPLAPGVDLSAYRIAQEALTNATRYAAAEGLVQVQVRWLPGNVELSVLNKVVPGKPASPLSGYGLIGMRERAHAVGGTLAIGPQPDGTFLVRANLPVGVAPAAPPARAASGS
jgi:signal transduction histidine kinase